jgi:hypothetical protein
MSKTKEAVILFTPEGVSRKYLPLASRLPVFLNEYPPEKFSVVTDYGPCPMDGSRAVVFKASLVDVSGRVIATAHSRRYISEYKDFEIAETAARQRLLAALGHGGDILDDDERSDFMAQGLDLKDPTPAKRSRDQVQVAAEKNSVEYASPQAVAEQQTTHTTVNIDTSPADHQTTVKEDVPAPLMRQLRALCAAKGVPVPEVRTTKEAEDMIVEVAMFRRNNPS